MKAGKLFIGIVVTFATLLVACQQEDEMLSQNLPPQVELTRAYDITRHEATIQGNVTPVGSGHICFVTLRYGVTDSLEHEVGFKNTERDITARLTNLQTATTYRCVLETGNEYSTISSDTLTFTTAQGGTPILSAITSYGRGPHRIGLQSSITDDGGLPILETGFYYWIAEGEKTKVTVAHHPDSLNMQRLIRLLEKDTLYQAQAYATNQLGEGVSPTFDFSVSDSLTLTMAGTLSEWLTLEEQHFINSLTLSGPINGSDIYLIHCMAGGEHKSNEYGRLAYLDLTETHVRAGGTYPSVWNVGNNTMDGFIFRDCAQFVELKLPATLKYVQSYMFTDCSNLQHLTFPRDMKTFEHFTGDYGVGDFPKLERFSIPDDAPNFRVHNGALYSKSGSTLRWYPPLSDTARADNFLPTLRKVAGGAFMGTELRYLELPKEVHTLENQGNVVYQNLEYLALPDSITSITWRFSTHHTPNLITLYWGKGAKSIDEEVGAYSFKFPPTLRHIYVPQSTRPHLSGPGYGGGISEIKDLCTIYIPIGASAAYRASSQWGMFTNIVEVEF
ncbi:MAG: leucine-rich repeat protein [Bacteroidaceae bacterium]|nr:leucine-rich repeat protein [Bacteroidaceae bacterium]